MTDWNEIRKQFPVLEKMTYLNPAGRSPMSISASAVEGGCPHFPLIFALSGALDLINSIGIDRISQRVLFLNKYLQQKSENLSLSVIEPQKDEKRSGIFIIKMKNDKRFKNELTAKNIIIPVKGEGIRVSVSFFNNEMDIERFIGEAEKIKHLF